MPSRQENPDGLRCSGFNFGEGTIAPGGCDGGTLRGEGHNVTYGVPVHCRINLLTNNQLPDCGPCFTFADTFLPVITNDLLRLVEYDPGFAAVSLALYGHGFHRLEHAVDHFTALGLARRRVAGMGRHRTRERQQKADEQERREVSCSPPVRGAARAGCRGFVVHSAEPSRHAHVPHSPTQ